MSEPISGPERAAWQAAYEKAQRVAPGLWALLVDPPNLPRICHYPTDDIASRRIVPPHLWAYSVQVEAVNALPRLLAENAALQAERDATQEQREHLAQRLHATEAARDALRAETARLRTVHAAAVRNELAVRDEAAGDRAEVARLQQALARCNCPHSVINMAGRDWPIGQCTICGASVAVPEVAAPATQPPLPDPAAPQQLGLLEDEA